MIIDHLLNPILVLAMDVTRVSWPIIYLLTAFLKLFLLHSYFSTDFDVHRNWLAITHSLPLSQWYYDETSQWTLDYPPFFAWFEWALSHIAALVDPQILTLQAEPYHSLSTLIFQRCSVIVSDIVLCYACYRASKLLEAGVIGGKKVDSWTCKLLLVGCYLGCAGLLIVDHVHFQYNGFLSGLFLLSLCGVIEGRWVEGGFWFSVLLNFKHIYMYAAPVYFVYLLRCHVFQPGQFLGVNWSGLIKLGLTVIGVLVASFGPFLSHIPQILSRLFPFQRGLCHAYWAPNIWALYNTADITATKLLQLAGIMPRDGEVHPLMSGLVQTSDFKLLPNITPLHCATLTLALLSLPLIKLFKSPSPERFLRSVVFAAFTSYMTGYHVHEKALLVILVPYGLALFLDSSTAKDYLFISVIGTYSLFPLLYQVQELPLKVVIHIMLHSFLHPTLVSLHGRVDMNRLEKVYLWGLVGHFIVSEIVCPVLLPGKEFLPLMLYSVYCAVGFLWAYVRVWVSVC
eukprot:sb/3463941/